MLERILGNHTALAANGQPKKWRRPSTCLAVALLLMMGTGSSLNAQPIATQPAAESAPFVEAPTTADRESEVEMPVRSSTDAVDATEAGAEIDPASDLYRPINENASVAPSTSAAPAQTDAAVLPTEAQKTSASPPLTDAQKLVYFPVLLVGLVVLGGVGAWLGIAFRNFTMPDTFFSSSMLDTFSKKLRYRFGPPLIGFGVGAFASMLIAENSRTWLSPQETAPEAAAATNEIKSATVGSKSTAPPSQEQLNAVAQSEYDLVGVSPISECGAPAVQELLGQKAQEFTGIDAGRNVAGYWWEITGFTTTGLASNGHQCHAFLDLHRGTEGTKTVPVNYTTGYEDASLTVQAFFEQ